MVRSRCYKLFFERVERIVLSYDVLKSSVVVIIVSFVYSRVCVIFGELGYMSSFVFCRLIFLRVSLGFYFLIVFV